MRFGRYYEEFEVGEVYRHWPGKTVTEYDDHLFCLLTMNHHPLHLDAHYAETATQFGRNVVVGNYVYSLLLGMSVPDVSGRAIANLEVESLKHVFPTFHGDTVYGQTEVLGKTEVLRHQRAGESRLVVPVGRARRHRPRHGAVRRERPALPGRVRRDVEQRLVRQPEPLPQDERLGDRDLRHREDHVVAHLGRLAETGAAAVDDPSAHRLEHRSRRFEVLVRPADRERERSEV